MSHPSPASTFATMTVDARRFVEHLRLSEATSDHFGLSAYQSPRLRIPICDSTPGVSQPRGTISRALHEQARCKACGELVTAKEVAAVGAGDGRWQDCPHCGATGKKARISWLLGQYPKYQNANGFETHRRIYNAPAAADALAAPWNADELGPILILAQGFTDAWALHEAGYGAVITAFGSAPNLRQLGMIERLAARTSCLVMVTADDTEGGRDLARRTVAGLQAQGLIAFSLTDYEEGAKNAAEFLRRYGARALARLIRDERLWNTHKAQTRRHPRRRAVAIAESELQGPADPRPKMPALDFPGGLGMLVP